MNNCLNRKSIRQKGTTITTNTGVSCMSNSNLPGQNYGWTEYNSAEIDKFSYAEPNFLNWKDRTIKFYYDTGLSRYYAFLEIIMIFMSVFIFFYELMDETDIIDWISITDFVISLIYTIDFLCRIIFTNNKISYLLKLGWFHFIISIPPMMASLYTLSTGVFTNLEIIRILRLLLILRLLPIKQFFNNKFSPLLVAILSLLLELITFITFFSGIVYIFEAPYRENFGLTNLTLFECFYYVCITLTSTGYGDISPVTATGRAICIIMVISIWVYMPVKIRKVVNVADLPKDLPHALTTKKTGQRHVILMGHLTESTIRRFLREFYHEKYGTVDFKVHIINEKYIDITKKKWYQLEYFLKVIIYTGSPFSHTVLFNAGLHSASAIFIVDDDSIVIHDRIRSLKINSIENCFNTLIPYAMFSSGYIIDPKCSVQDAFLTNPVSLSFFKCPRLYYTLISYRNSPPIYKYHIGLPHKIIYKDLFIILFFTKEILYPGSLPFLHNMFFSTPLKKIDHEEENHHSLIHKGNPCSFSNKNVIHPYDYLLFRDPKSLYFSEVDLPYKSLLQLEEYQDLSGFSLYASTLESDLYTINLNTIYNNMKFDDVYHVIPIAIARPRIINIPSNSYNNINLAQDSSSNNIEESNSYILQSSIPSLISPRQSQSYLPLPTDFDTLAEKYAIFINPANMVLENEDRIFVFSRNRKDAFALATGNTESLNMFLRQKRLDKTLRDTIEGTRSNFSNSISVELPTLKVNDEQYNGTLSLGYLYDISETASENTISGNPSHAPSIPHFDNLSDDDRINELYQDERLQYTPTHSNNNDTPLSNSQYHSYNSTLERQSSRDIEDNESVIQLSVSDNHEYHSLNLRESTNTILNSNDYVTIQELANATHSNSHHSTSSMSNLTTSQDGEDVIRLNESLNSNNIHLDSSTSEFIASDEDFKGYTEKQIEQILQMKNLILFCGYNSIVQSIINNILNQSKEKDFVIVIMDKEKDPHIVETNRILFLQRDILDYMSYVDINLYESKRIIILPIDEEPSIIYEPVTEGTEPTLSIHPGDITVATILQFIYKILYNDGNNNIISPHQMSSASLSTTTDADDSRIQITANISEYPYQYSSDYEDKHQHIIDFRYFFISKCLVYLHNEQSIHTILPYLPPYVLNQSNKYYLSPAFMNGSIYIDTFMNLFSIQYFNNPLLLELILSITTGQTSEIIPSIFNGKYTDYSQLRVIQYPSTAATYFFSDVFKFYLEKQNTLILGIKKKSDLFDHSTIPYLIPDPQTPVTSDDYLFVLDFNDSV